MCDWGGSGGALGWEAETRRGVGGGVAPGNTNGYDGTVPYDVYLSTYLRGGFVHRNTRVVGISK